MTIKRVEPVMRLPSSELGRPMKSPKSRSSGEAPEAAPPFKSSSSTSPTPNSSSSRRESFSERTRSISRKFSFFKDSKDDKQQNPDSATQGVRVHEPTGDIAIPSPTRRSSSRKANAASVPTSPKKATERPIIWEANAQHVSKSGEPVPAPSSYRITDFLPAQPPISPLTEKSFTFGEEFRSQTHSRSSSHQHVIPSISRYDAEHKNNSSPLSQAVYPNADDATKPFDRLPRPARDVLEGSTKALSVTTGAYQGTEWNPNTSPRDLRSIKDDSNYGGAGTSTSPLLTNPGNNIQVFQGPTSPAITELEAPLPPSHPLLLEARHQKHFASRTAPSSPPLQPARDLPLRHYRSQEQFSASGTSFTKEKAIVIPQRSNSQRASTQVSLDIKALLSHSMLTTTVFSAPPQSPAAPSTLGLAASSNTMSPAANSAIQLYDSSAAAPAVLDSISNPNDSHKPPPGLRPEPPAAGSVDLSNNNVIPPTANHQEASKSPPPNLPPDSPAPELFSSTHYKTSATNNAPFFLSPNSSAALIDFLAATPPTTPPEPRAKSLSDKIEDVPTTSQQSNIPGRDAEHAAAPPPAPEVRSKPNISRPFQFAQGPTSATPSVSVEKKPKWKKLFGSRGAAKQKRATTGPEVVIVGKGEWYKIDLKKKKQKGQSSTQEGGQDVNGNSGPSGQKPTTTIEAGVMGVGKDGVWISGKNFLKS